MLAVALLWAGIGTAVLRTGFDLLGPQPLSRLAADDRAVDLFGPTLVAAGLLLLAFGAHVWWRQPTGRGFLPLLVAGMVGQIVAGMIPIGEAGTSDPVHVAGGLVLGASIPAFTWRYAVGQPTGPWRRRAHALFGLQAAATTIGIVLSQRGVAALAEIVPALAFHAWVLAVALDPRADDPSVRPDAAVPVSAAATTAARVELVTR